MFVKRISIHIILPLFLLMLVQCNQKSDDYFSETVKVSLRQVGHELLTINNDLSTPVNPIKKLSASKYEISFINHLLIEPSQLVAIIQNNLKKANLPNQYLVEVYNCTTNEVAYSYLMKKQVEEGIIPCANRVLSKDCYYIQISFLNTDKKLNTSNNSYWLLLILIPFLIVVMRFMMNRKRIEKPILVHDNSESIVIGAFSFYPEQNLLIKSSDEISLSKKECELLQILAENKNQTTKRELLTKKVWEDNGVVVGRSLDTYISKLRKKLKDDDTIQIKNVHGVGYKLIVN
ncbi:helix-turn-helix domain-containing protein [Tenacibaculum sp. M341]|nr:helix-turn-helix domain-containing protein [Tenacibaculum sp. M341]